MPGNCDALADWLEYEIKRQQWAQEALNTATEDAALAVAALTAAKVAAAACAALVPNLAAFAICEAPALAAVGAAQIAVDYYGRKVEECNRAYQQITEAVQKLEQLLSECKLAEANDRDTEQYYAQASELSGRAVQVPNVDGYYLDDAHIQVALAEDAVRQAQYGATGMV